MKRFPSKDEIQAWIADNPGKTSKKDIARAFGIKGAARIELKKILKVLHEDGVLHKRRKTYSDPNSLPPVSVLRISEIDGDGDVFAEPEEWYGEGKPPRILYTHRDGDPAVAVDDRVLARIAESTGADTDYVARLIRKIGTAPERIIGIFRKGAEGGRILPIEKGSAKEWRVAASDTHNAKEGELVEATQSGPKSRMGLPAARIIEVLGDPASPKAVSLIAIHQHGIPDAFPDDVIGEADSAKPAILGDREDLRHLPLVTIDPADARDRDDAIYAHPDDDPKNPSGHVVWVAIADVANYVRPGTALDKEAQLRGNSTDFPDRVVPMLPDSLSADLCSLHEGVDRPCMAVRMVLDAKGNLKEYRFTRGLMNSTGSLNYQEVQDGQDGNPKEKVAPLMADVVTPLYDAYQSAKTARSERQPLDLDLPERKIELNDDGKVNSVSFRDRLDAHRLIEEFMILANVAAARELTAKKHPLLFRVHEEPSPEKLQSLRDVAQSSGLVLAKGQVLQTHHLNNLLNQAEGTEFDELINLSTLRSMTQAYYNRENFGHFGLALKEYAHFTSPIRRYSDLIVHRALISANGLGKDGLSAEDIEKLPEVAVQISDSERRSMAAERDTTDRYLAAYLSERVGSEFSGRVSGIAKFGAFVKLDETGADGLIPVRSLGREFFRFDADNQSLIGEDSGFRIALGQRVTVKLAEAVPVTGGLLLELVSVEGKPVPKTQGSRGARFGGRRAVRSKKKAAKVKRKVSRTR